MLVIMAYSITVSIIHAMPYCTGTGCSALLLVMVTSVRITVRTSAQHALGTVRIIVYHHAMLHTGLAYSPSYPITAMLMLYKHCCIYAMIIWQ